MKTLSIEQFRERYHQLPKDLRDTVSSVGAIDTTALLDEITHRHNLNGAQNDSLTDHVGLVLLGVLRKEGLTAELVKELGISSDTATKIARELDQSLFSKVADSLEKAAKNTQERVVEPSADNEPLMPPLGKQWVPAPGNQLPDTSQPPLGEKAMPTETQLGDISEQILESAAQEPRATSYQLPTTNYQTAPPQNLPVAEPAPDLQPPISTSPDASFQQSTSSSSLQSPVPNISDDESAAILKDIESPEPTPLIVYDTPTTEGRELTSHSPNTREQSSTRHQPPVTGNPGQSVFEKRLENFYARPPKKRHRDQKKNWRGPNAPGNQQPEAGNQTDPYRESVPDVNINNQSPHAV